MLNVINYKTNLKLSDFEADIIRLMVLFPGKMGVIMLHSVSTPKYSVRFWTEGMGQLLENSEK